MKKPCCFSQSLIVSVQTLELIVLFQMRIWKKQKMKGTGRSVFVAARVCSKSHAQG